MAKLVFNHFSIFETNTKSEKFMNLEKVQLLNLLYKRQTVTQKLVKVNKLSSITNFTSSKYFLFKSREIVGKFMQKMCKCDKSA